MHNQAPISSASHTRDRTQNTRFCSVYADLRKSGKTAPNGGSACVLFSPPSSLSVIPE